jgi:hypothetical protein
MYILGEYYSDLALNKICFLHFVQNARSFPNKLDCIQWCDFFHSSWNLQLYFFFFDVEEGVLGSEFHLLFVDWDIVIKCKKQILFKAKSVTIFV